MAKKSKTPAHAERAHSKIGASSYYRWGKCPASVRLSEGIEQVESSHAKEGTAAHELAERLLRDQPAEFEEEMLDAVMVYVNYVKDLAKGAEYFGIEEKFALTDVHPDAYGTADAVIYREHINLADDGTTVVEKVLHVIDYKHGQGIPVEVENNKQLLFYALGALSKLKVPCDSVQMTIVQPRCHHADGPIRSWRIDAIDLLDFSADLVEDIKRVFDPDAPIVPGDHCRFCPAAPVCPGLQSMALTTAQEEFSPAYSYDPELLGEVLLKLPAIEAWIKAVKEFAFREAQAGRTPPGHKLVPKRATRKWKDELEAEMELLELDLSPKEIMKEPALLSPAQIEKILPKDKRKEIEKLVVKESSGETLVPYTDKRKAAKPAIETEFSKIEEE